ncbi:ribonuclease I [Salmonella enterica subsp. enterica]|uniref:Ribonuclease I n=1 Tax=Salmonella enterica I TaxID=59201 RepID=A0A379WYX4_SALET|nr:ribonuclease I [Salmonella enterica subsp. enterica]
MGNIHNVYKLSNSIMNTIWHYSPLLAVLLTPIFAANADELQAQQYGDSLTMCWRFPGKPVFVKASMNAAIGNPMSAVCKKSQPTKQTF